MTKHLNEADRGNVVLATVIFLANDDESEQSRVQGVELLGELAEVVGKDYCEQFAGMTLIALAQDTQFSVRRAVAGVYHQMAKVVSQQFFMNRLFNVFKELLKD